MKMTRTIIFQFKDTIFDEISEHYFDSLKLVLDETPFSFKTLRFHRNVSLRLTVTLECIEADALLNMHPESPNRRPHLVNELFYCFFLFCNMSVTSCSRSFFE